MAKMLKDIGDFGPIEIIREGLEVLQSNIKFFFYSLLGLVLPATILVQLLAIVLNKLVISSFTSLSMPESRQGNLRVGQVHQSLQDYLPLLRALSGLPIVLLLQIVGVYLFGVFVNSATTAISNSSTILAVGLFYNGKSFCFPDVFRTVLCLWRRPFTTLLWGNVFMVAILFVQVGLQALTMFLLKPYLSYPFAILGIFLPLLVTIPAGLYAGIIVGLAVPVSILDSEENNYGRAALKKAWNLVEGKTWVALRVLLFLSTAAIIPVSFQYAINAEAWKDSWALVLFWIFYAISASVVLQFQYVCICVLYVSCMDYHGESMTANPGSFDSLPITKNGGYQSLGGGQKIHTLWDYPSMEKQQRLARFF